MACFLLFGDERKLKCAAPIPQILPQLNAISGGTYSKAPLIDYFRNARMAFGVTSKQIVDVTGKKNMVSHGFNINRISRCP